MSSPVFSATCLFLFATSNWIVFLRWCYFYFYFGLCQLIFHLFLWSYLSSELFLVSSVLCSCFSRNRCYVRLSKVIVICFFNQFLSVLDNLFMVIFLHLAFGFSYCFPSFFLISYIDLVLFLSHLYSSSSEGCFSWIISVARD